MIKTIFVLFIAIVAGVAAGGASALWMTGLVGPAGPGGVASVNVAGWRSDWAIGSSSADAYTRARVARFGLLALSKEEAVYFNRGLDDNGDRLTERCDYRITGTSQDADWWSITLYDVESRLPMNADDALSIDATKVAGDDAWMATISPKEPAEGRWVSSRGAGAFNLTLRLYRPSQTVLLDPKRALNPPGIERTFCRGAL